MAVAAFKSVRNKTCETTWHFAIVLNFAMHCILARREIKFCAAHFYVMYASGLLLLVSAMSASAQAWMSAMAGSCNY